jgi:hypothetical protein
MSKTHFFCIVESENLGCYPKIAKFDAIFPLKRQYKNLVGLTKDNHKIWSLHKDESTNKTVFNNSYHPNRYT